MVFSSNFLSDRPRVLVALLALCVAAGLTLPTSASAQSINYPYNPDSDTDENIGTPDLLSLLSVFGTEFLPDPIAIDSLTLEEYLQLLQESIAAANDALDAIPAPECDPCDGLSEVTFGTTTYPVVPIGCECWFAKNLDTYVFANGDVIPALVDVDPAVDDTWQAWANNNPIDGARYGRMYSSGARSDARKICPSGWKVPNNDDINALEAEIDGGDGTARLLALPYDAVTGMDYLHNMDATNDFGFDGIPVSGMTVQDGNGWNMMNTSLCWGGEESSYGYESYNGFFGGCSGDAFAVRCVKFQENDLGCTDPDYLEFERNAEFDDGSCLTPVVRGCTDPDANNFNPEANTDVGSCVYGLQPPACDFESSYTYHGVTYPLVEVAGNCWFGENLRASAFSNGDAIGEFEAGSTETASPWYAPITPWISLDDDEAFGYAYNQSAILDARNACPTGWHVSSQADWDALAAAFGGYMTLNINLASTGIAGDQSGYWNVSTTNENGTGLNVHPAGAVYPLTGTNPSGNEAIFALDDGRYLWGFQWWSDMGMVLYDMEAASTDPNEFGVAIRCVKD